MLQRHHDHDRGMDDRQSVGAYLCGATHDHEDVEFPLVPKPITLGKRVWIAADAFVAPGVTIGDGTVVGARSSVFKDLPPWQICMGTPAKVLAAWSRAFGLRIRRLPGWRLNNAAGSPTVENRSR